MITEVKLIQDLYTYKLKMEINNIPKTLNMYKFINENINKLESSLSLQEIKARLIEFDSTIESKISEIAEEILDRSEEYGNFQLLNNVLLIVRNLTHQVETLELQKSTFSHFSKTIFGKGKTKNVFKEFIFSLLNTISSQLQSRTFLSPEKRLREKTKQMKELLSISSRIQNQLENLQDTAQNSEKINFLTTKLAKIKEEMETLSGAISKIRNYQKKDLETRQSFLKIGGETIFVKDEKSNSILEGTYLSVDKFKQELTNAGYEIATLPILSRPCLTYKKDNEQAQALYDVLTKLGMEKISWKSFESEDRIFIVPDYNEDHLESLEGLKIKEFTTDTSSNRGTVILTSGGIGTYTYSKAEMLYFLLKGFNVAGFDFAGYGQSTGNPSGQVLKRNMETIYKHLKEHYSLTEDKTLLSTICMSGGPATYLAKKYPGISLLLNQSPGQYSDLVEDLIESRMNKECKHLENHKKNYLQKELNKWKAYVVKKLLFVISRIISPNWVIKKEIRHVKGQVGIILATDDDIIDIERDYQQIKQAFTGGQYNTQVTSMIIPGKHGTSWLEAVQDKEIPSSLSGEKAESAFKLYSTKKINRFELEQVFTNFKEYVEEHSINYSIEFCQAINKMAPKLLPESPNIAKTFLAHMYQLDFAKLERYKKTLLNPVFPGRKQMDLFLDKLQLHEDPF